MQLKKISRKAALPLIGALFIEGCGGGGGGGVPQTGQAPQNTGPSQPFTPAAPTPTPPTSTPITPTTPPVTTPPSPTTFNFLVLINGAARTIVLQNANPTALQVTQLAAETSIDSSWLASYGQFVSSLNSQTFEARQERIQHWKLYVRRAGSDPNQSAAWSSQSADHLRLNPNDQVEWRAEL